MSLYPLGISRSRDLPRVAGELTVGQAAVRWVLADQLAGAVMDAPQVVPEPLQHAAALDAIHRKICVLPMRFGTGPQDEAAIRSLLETRHRDLLQRLDRLEGTCEIGLRITLPKCRTAQAEPPRGTPLPISYLQQRRAHYQRQDSFGHRAHLAVESLVKELQGTYRDWRTLTSSPPGLVRLAFLVERELVGAFEKRVAASAIECSGKQPALLGPWPPYSFV